MMTEGLGVCHTHFLLPLRQVMNSDVIQESVSQIVAGSHSFEVVTWTHRPERCRVALGMGVLWRGGNALHGGSTVSICSPDVGTHSW